MAHDPRFRRYRAGTPDQAEGAETYLRRLAEAELRWVLEQPEPPPGSPSGRPPLAPTVQAVNRVCAAAGALIASGEIDEAAAMSVLAGLVSAMTERSKLPPVHPYKSLFVPRFRRSSPERPARAVRLVPVGHPVPFPESGDENRLLHLLTMALASDLAAISYAGRIPVSDHIPASRQLPASPIGPYGPTSASGHLTFTDDRGTSYQVRTTGGGTSDGIWWSGEFCLSPVPPHDIRWIDIVPVSGAGAVRVDLTAPVPGQPPVGPVTAVSPATADDRAGALPPVGQTPAERLLDSFAHDLLWSTLWTGDDSGALSELADMAPALAAAGAIQPRSPALGRLAALAQRLGIDLPAGLAAAPHAGLPHAWNNVLADRDRRDGRDGLAPAIAVLPETDGALFAITGLYSTEQAVILRALAWGWHAERTRFPRTGKRYTWWALDNVGHWHIGQQTNAAIGGVDGHGDTDIAFIPPLHPAATSLDIILTGPSTRASATTPLTWQALS